MEISALDFDSFTALRADWYAQGCPADHPYMAPQPEPKPVEGLVYFADGSRYAGKQA